MLLISPSIPSCHQAFERWLTKVESGVQGPSNKAARDNILARLSALYIIRDQARWGMVKLTRLLPCTTGRKRHKTSPVQAAAAGCRCRRLPLLRPGSLLPLDVRRCSPVLPDPLAWCTPCIPVIRLCSR